MSSFTETEVEQIALTWFESLGYSIHSGPEIAPGELAAERNDYREVVLEQRLRMALIRLNPAIPSDALDEAFRRILRAESPSLVINNHSFHQMLIDGVPVEYTGQDGRVIHDYVRLIDFENLDNNDWLVVNQFTVEENN